MTKTYEMLTILNPTLSDQDQNALSEHLRKTIEAVGGTIKEENLWGKQKLAYPIAGNDMGTYVLLTFDIDAQAIKGLNETLRLMEGLLRYLITEWQPKPVVAAPNREKEALSTEKVETAAYTAPDEAQGGKPDEAELDKKLDELLSDADLVK